jgi:colicin import membrane protein
VERSNFSAMLMSWLFHGLVIAAFLWTAAPVMKISQPISVELWNTPPAAPLETAVIEPPSQEKQELVEPDSEPVAPNPSVSQNTVSSNEQDAIQLKRKPNAPEQFDREDRANPQQPPKATPQETPKTVPEKPSWLREKQKSPSTLFKPSEVAQPKRLDQKTDPNLSQGQEGGGSDPSYAAALRARVLQNIFFAVPPDLRGNPSAEFWIEQSASGDVISVRLLKSSGLPGYDEAVARAIERASPLPKRSDGSVVPTFRMTFRPKDAQ